MDKYVEKRPWKNYYKKDLTFFNFYIINNFTDFVS